MPKGRPPLVLTSDQKAQLCSIAKSLPSGLTLRAKIVLDCAAGMSNKAVAEKLDVLTVGKWRKRFVEGGGYTTSCAAADPQHTMTSGLPRSSRAPFRRRTRRTGAFVARHAGLSKSTVQRRFELFSVKPHLRKTFKLSTDPFFVEKVLVGLYLSPLEHAAVLCVDEKSQIQALDRTQPTLGVGYVEGYHGTTTLFAALDVGQVIATCKQCHQDFLERLRNVPKELDLVADNYATHKHPKVHAWIAQRPRYHLHFMPTYASWLNQVERWVHHGDRPSPGIVTSAKCASSSSPKIAMPLPSFGLPLPTSKRFKDCVFLG